MKKIDLRSDTVTVFTENMKKSMLTCELGDDVFNSDPTVQKLEELAAKIVGKEASVFVPTGTMANQLAILSHANGQKGKEIICGQWSHIAWDENASTSLLSGGQLRTLPQNENGEMDLNKIQKAIRTPHPVYPETAIVCLENTFHGQALSLDYIQKVRELTQKHNLPLHLDGARLFNAAWAVGGDVQKITKYFDSLQFCLSKGLCCPVGSILAGSKDFCDKAKKYRKMLGGTMRQTGILAGPGIVALTEQIEQIQKDHQMAKNLYQQFKEKFSEYLNIKEYKENSTNMIFFQFKNEQYNIEKQNVFIDFMETKNIIVTNAWEPDYMFRFVIHYYIREQQIEAIVQSMQDFLTTIYQKN
ncbi:Pyridoxal phosphate-dependent transferase [Pseudocohnilembus persalinus]|uniref:Pyridoxal phosphate-dependent transferase n=1 Tax=Pseudocohnilembus persalinus TaxID=266149 RepID=A0A0V0R3D1_PSEPJ|nr:Pyridoxal phosphate-dependent transferase [Pseudocohnilembus persalinus]|eukprot:KRX08973.1 Pyridoxal phosphate-dependent transferase [Pseudocohnilembus persalinus]